VLLLEEDEKRRDQLAHEIRAAGIPVVAVGRIAEIERWPDGEVVVTDAARFTPWWKKVGATHVIVLADRPEQGTDACSRGATAWTTRMCSPDELVALIRSLLQAGS
jgi:DNA-binding response OmpR family regulator